MLALWRRKGLPTVTRRAHRTHMGSVAKLSPFFLPAVQHLPGVPIGYYVDTLEPFEVDIQLWKRMNIIEATIVFVDGDIGVGKTSLAIIIALNSSYMAVEENRTFKIMYEITRRNNGVAELSGLTEALGGTVIDMRTYGLNILDQTFGMSAFETLDVLLECFNYVEKRDATTFEVTIMMAALHDFLKECEESERYKRTAGLPYYLKHLAKLTTSRVATAMADHPESELFREAESYRSNQAVEDEADKDEYLTNAVLMACDIEIDEKSFKRIRQSCLMTLSRLQKGEYGEVFNGTHSFSELLSHNALGIDYTNVNVVTIGLLQTLLWKYKRSAINSDDPEIKFRFTFDMEIHDENRESWTFAPYRREVPRYLKRIRSTSTTMWFNLHRIPGDLLTLEPEAKEAAMNAIREGDVYMHALRDKPAARETCKYFEYSETVMKRMSRQKKGGFIVRIGKSEPQAIQVQLSTSQRRITFSEGASMAKTRVTPTLLAISERD